MTHLWFGAGHNEIKRKLLNKLQETSLLNRPGHRLNVQKSQSSNKIGHMEEEKKQITGRQQRGNSESEAPPKDSNERVERLLIKLENAARMNDMEEITRELRYLHEFDLMTSHYNED